MAARHRGRPAAGYWPSGCFCSPPPILPTMRSACCPSRLPGGEGSLPGLLAPAGGRGHPGRSVAGPCRARPVEAVAAAHLAHAAGGGRPAGTSASIPSYLTAHVPGTAGLHRCCGVDDSYHYFKGCVRGWRVRRRSQPSLSGSTAPSACTIGCACGRAMRLSGLALVPRSTCRSWPGGLHQRRARGARLMRDPQVFTILPRPSTGRATTCGEPGPAPEQLIVRGFFILVLAILVLRSLRWPWLRRRNVRLDYPGGGVSVPRGLTIQRPAWWPGCRTRPSAGARRCSTCRVRAGHGAERLAPPDLAERRVLARSARRRTCGWRQARLTADLASDAVDAGYGWACGRLRHPARSPGSSGRLPSCSG